MMKLCIITENNYNGLIGDALFKCFGVEVKPEYSVDIEYYILNFGSQLRKTISEVSSPVLSFNLPNQLTRNFRGNQPVRWTHQDRNGLNIAQVTSIEILKAEIKDRTTIKRLLSKENGGTLPLSYPLITVFRGRTKT